MTYLRIIDCWRLFNQVDFVDHVERRFTYEQQWKLAAGAGWPQ